MSLFVAQEVLMVPVFARYLPQDLTGRITKAQWDIICDAFVTASSDATPFACCCEWFVCCISGCCPVFCFHECISYSFMKCLLASKINALNARMFNGLPVLSIFHAPNIGINIRYDILPNTTPLAIAIPLGTEQVEITNSQPMMPNVYRLPNDKYLQPSAPTRPPTSNEIEQFPLLYQQQQVVPSAPPISESIRTMQVTLPDWVTVGSVFTVKSPDGLSVKVTVPPNQIAGDIILVHY